jgi:hypothetical protein
MKRTLVLAACGVLILATSVGANPLKEQEKPGVPFQGELNFRDVGSAPEGPGTIQYDTGVFTGVGNIPLIADNFSFGNQFGPCPLPFTVTNVSIFMALVDGGTTGSGNAFVTIFSALNTAGTGAGAITSPSVPLNANAFNMVGVNVPYTGTGTSTFLAGVWNAGAGSTAAPTPCGTDCVGFDSNDGGQGFHGFAMEDLGGGNFSPITDANAILRVSGINVPVELMSFSIED